MREKKLKSFSDIKIPEGTECYTFVRGKNCLIDDDFCKSKVKVPKKKLVYKSRKTQKIYRVFNSNCELIFKGLMTEIMDEYGLNYNTIASAVSRKTLVARKYYFSKNEKFFKPQIQKV